MMSCPIAICCFKLIGLVNMDAVRNGHEVSYVSSSDARKERDVSKNGDNFVSIPLTCGVKEQVRRDVTHVQACILQ